MSDMKINFRYLRPRKAELLAERYRMYDNEVEARITVVENGKLIPAYRDTHGDTITGIIDAEGRFVNDSHCVDFPEEVEIQAQKYDYVPFDGEIVYMGFFNPHWGHFITDCLSCFWCMSQIKAERYVFSYYKGETPEIAGNIRMALELLGVLDKIEIVSQPVCYGKIYVPRKGMIPRGHLLMQSADVYRTIINRAMERYTPPATEKHEKIILSRSRFSKAVLNDIGTKEIEKLFQDNGFTPVYPEQMTLVELIGCLSGASEVAAISGTPAHNLLFAPNGMKLTVLEKYANINNYQQGIDKLKELDVTYIDAAYFVWSVSPGLGPFIFGNTEELARFVADNGLITHVTNTDIPGVLRKYFRLYYRHYKRRWIMPEWLEPETGLLREAYAASEPLFGKWLDGSRPLFLSDLLHPRFIAGAIRRFIRRSRN